MKEVAAQVTQTPKATAESEDSASEKTPASDGDAKPEAKPDKERLSADLRAVRAQEDRSIRELLEGIGNEGAFRVRVTRTEPKECRDPATGRMVPVAGYLKTYETALDEQDLHRWHGGGTYALKINKRTPKGSFEYFAQRTTTIAGDPNLDDPSLNRVIVAQGSPAAAAQPAGESPSLASKAMDVLTGQLTALREERTERDDLPPAIKMLFDQSKEQAREARETNARLQHELAETRREFLAAQTSKPPEDSFKDRMINGLMSEETSRITALRAQFDSELRMVKDNHTAELRRLEDRYERHESQAQQSHERELVSVRQSNEVMLSAARSSFELQAKLLETDNRRLQEQLTETRREVTSLRERVDKQKSVVEQMKEINALKEALGIDDEASHEGTIEKILGALTNPAALDAIKGIVGRPSAAAPAAQTAQVQAPQAPVLVQTPDGRTHLKRGSVLVPLRAKKKIIQAATTNADGTPGPVLELPAVAPELIAQVVGFLERAFAGNQDPVVVAQSYRSMVPEDIMTVIREHGVDVFLSKVAKLPGTSILANQAGRNWVRKVGEALVE
jgi:hypothetical protein